MTLQASLIIKQFEEMSPKHYAFDWDNVGLQVGTLNKPVAKVMITLDVLENVVDEAIEKSVDLIIAHHPLLFTSLKQIDLETPKGRIIKKLIQYDIAVYAAHTNLDVAVGGVNDVMAELLHIQNVEPLIETEKDELIKLVVFVPEDYSEGLRNALSEAGAGHIGAYSHCTFQSAGQGTFKPLDGTNPFIGKQGAIERVDEHRVETIVPKTKLAKTLKAMKKAHPYEEVAYDLYPLVNEGESIGVGRVGRLSKEITLRELCEVVKEQYDVPALRYVGDPDQTIQTVALLGGSGEKYIHAAKEKEADVYITGDLTFHLAQDAEQMGLAVIDPGHHVEKVITSKLQRRLQKKCGTDVDFIVSNSQTEPFRFM
ncbi:Nif3-like dinuclear metal center hexameric protein [Halobacillus shinanisalinarum]|uniref:GTP cyclohydrolase 1 type 2 homolog n=1 Tax=Halobacillus shinanisalinarum TaxID=2932258 RepID=A0ABY4GZZ1_9BACI|nr:Nif3-like dinuclear metal center hexameric protein [Halobacillus shinanisalinarum]UOQ93760.1 Nif3-like dinuclear metal center hexameric protein [Halobacillus shinanisalinarum]